MDDVQTLAQAWQDNPALHPWTCNGGNPDFTTHHDHEVVMTAGSTGFVCPECKRFQPYREFERQMLSIMTVAEKIRKA